jgi:hypothetical protein
LPGEIITALKDQFVRLGLADKENSDYLEKGLSVINTDKRLENVWTREEQDDIMNVGSPLLLLYVSLGKPLPIQE